MSGRSSAGTPRTEILRGFLSMAAFAMLGWSAAVGAQARHSDFQIWSSASATIPLGERAELRVDGLVQITDDASRVGRKLVRTVMLARLTDRVKLGGGYVWTGIAPGAGVRISEHRALQELDYRWVMGQAGAVVSLRSQMEERWREREAGTSLRWRQLSRLEVPVEGVSLVLWDEYFHEFRRTRWSGRAGPGLMINFVGIRLPVGKAIAVEPGYLNQTQFDAGPNRVRHAAAIFATARF